jgi:ketosteroid isomerase-like protein
MRTFLITVASLLCIAGCATPATAPDPQVLQKQVTDAETAFAKSMADRDLNAFASFVAEDAVFLNGGKPLRGKAAIVEHWKRFYSGPNAPFSWRPDLVQVLPSGQLAQSTGPVYAPDGKLIAHFYSTWRLESPGVWKVVLDNGYDACNCPAK